MAERIIPAADLSEQISTAGLEASGTGNMKFALNGALTIGTLDGANIEIMEHVGRDNIVIFGLTADEVAQRRGSGYNPRQIIESTPELRQAVDAIASGVFSPDDPARYRGLMDGLHDSDWFMVAADFESYSIAQRQVDQRWRDTTGWQATVVAQHRQCRLVFIRPHDRRICPRDLEGPVKPPASAIEALLAGTHADPFSLLGVHDGPDGAFARAILPGAETADAFGLDGTPLGALTRVDDRGLFEGRVAGKPQPVTYRCTGGGHAWRVTDPYQLWPGAGSDG